MCLTYTVQYLPYIPMMPCIPYLSYLSYIPHILYIWNITTTPSIHTIPNIHAIHTIPTLHRKHSLPIIATIHTIQTIHTVISNIPCPTYLHTIPTIHTIPTNHAIHTMPTIHTKHTILSKHAIPDRPYTSFILNIPYHTPTTPQGGRGGGRAWCIYIYIRYIRTSSWDRLPTFPKGMDRSRRLTTSLNCIWNGQVVLSPLGVGVGGLLLSQQQHHKTQKVASS